MNGNSECEETAAARRARPRAFSRPGAVAHMPRFSLRQLLLATILVGIGLGMLVFGTDGINRARDLVVLPLLMIVLGARQWDLAHTLCLGGLRSVFWLVWCFFLHYDFLRT